MTCRVDYSRQTHCVLVSFHSLFSSSSEMDRTITFRTWKGDSKNVSGGCERNSPENNASLLPDIEQKLIYICGWSFMNWIKGRQTPAIPSSLICWWIPWHMLINSLLCLAALQKENPHSLILFFLFFIFFIFIYIYGNLNDLRPVFYIIPSPVFKM